MLNALPKSMHAKAKARLHEIWQAATHREAHEALDAMVADFAAKYDKAVKKLTDDRDEPLAFYDFPAEHWKQAAGCTRFAGRLPREHAQRSLAPKTR